MMSDGSSGLVDADKAGESETSRSRMGERRTGDVKLTEAGLILIITGIVLGIFLIVIPAFYYLAFLGFIMFIAGALLIFLGRKVFGTRHSTYASVSLSIIVVMNFLLAVGGFQFPYSIIPVTAVQGISEVFLTYGLQGSKGRVLLWAAYATILASVITLASKTLANPSDFLIPVIELLTFIAAATFTLALFLPFYRIRKGEIPVPQLMPGQ